MMTSLVHAAFETRERPKFEINAYTEAAGSPTFRVERVEEEEEGMMGQAMGSWRSKKASAVRSYMVLCVSKFY